MKSRVAFVSEAWKKISTETTEVRVITDHPLPDGSMDKVVLIKTTSKPCKKEYPIDTLMSVEEFRLMYKAVEHWLTVLENDGDVL